MSEKHEQHYEDVKGSAEDGSSGRSGRLTGSEAPQEVVLDTRPRWVRFYRSTLWQIIIVGLCSFSAPGL